MTYREYAERYAGMTFDGTETSSLWIRPVPEAEINLAAEGRRLNFRVIDGDRLHRALDTADPQGSAPPESSVRSSHGVLEARDG